MAGLKGFTVDFAVYEKGKKAPQYTIESDINGEISLADFLQFTKNNLIVIADTVLKEEQSAGFDKDPIVRVDGRTGVPVSKVSPLGKLEFISRQSIKEIVQFIYNQIEFKSPVRSGLYKKSNYVFLNGRQVANDAATLQSWLATNPQVENKDKLRFVNIQPYARKLERRGVTGQRVQNRLRKSKDDRGRSGRSDGKVLAPNGTYYLAMRAASRIYKFNSKIRFAYLPGSDFGLSAKFLTKDGQGKVRLNKKQLKKSRTYLYPTITIQVDSGGLK